MLLLLTLILPFAASADSFYPESADLKPGTTGIICLVLDNSQQYYGFQADIRLPEGIRMLEGSDGEADITLTERADEGDYRLNSNVLSDGTLILSAFSANHQPFTGTDGVLVNLNVSVSDDFSGGTVEISNVLFVSSQDTDVEFDSTSSTLGVASAYELGDVNGDGKVTASDVVSLVNCIIGNKPSSFIDEVADVNKDGKISASDVVSVVNIIINKQ